MPMRVLLSERCFKGHRKIYMKWLSKIPDIEFYVLAPENIGVEEDHYYKYELTRGVKSLKDYLKWIILMKKIVKKENIDILHILDGDSIMRWFGLGISHIGVPKAVITYHHFFSGFARRISYRLLGRGMNRLCVAHTASVEQSLKSCGLKSVARCEYPAFSFDSIASRNPMECKIKYDIPLHVPTIGIIGGLNKYKNIIPFLEMLKDLDSDFYVLICGKDSEVTKDEIKKAIEPYSDRVTLCIKFLNEEEYKDAIVASDIIFCIYGYDFDGASGPLTDGVCAEKFILSCKHGSLGDIVSHNQLGLTADCSSKDDMLKQTKLAVRRANEFKYSDIANQYRDSLNPYIFQEVYKQIYCDKK